MIGYADFPTTRDGRCFGGQYTVRVTFEAVPHVTDYCHFGSGEGIPSAYISASLIKDTNTALAVTSAFQAVCDAAAEEGGYNSGRPVFLTTTIKEGETIRGASLGLATCIAMSGFNIPPTTVFTGSVRKFGSSEKGIEGLRRLPVGPVDCVPIKAVGVMNLGHTLCAPAGNRAEKVVQPLRRDPYARVSKAGRTDNSWKQDKTIQLAVEKVRWVATVGDAFDVIAEM